MGKTEKRPPPLPSLCNNDDDDSYFSLLPDEIVLVIFNKILDLKTLCLCKPVSTKFNLIVNQVNNIRFVASRVNSKIFFNGSFYITEDEDFFWEFPVRALLRLSKPYYLDPDEEPCPRSTFDSESFRSAIQSIDKFDRLKSLCIDLPFTGRDGICTIDSSSSRSPDFYKWKIKFCETIESFVFVSPDTFCEYVSSGDEQEQEDQQRGTACWGDKLGFALRQCLMDAAVRFRMLLGCTLDFPLLEKVSITQSGNRGGVSINGRNKIVEMRERLLDSVGYKLNVLTKELPTEFSVHYAPLLKLPVSGYLMKRVTLVTIQWTTEILDGDDSFYMTPINLDDFADKEEAAYAEAVVEMLKICRRGLPAQL